MAIRLTAPAFSNGAPIPTEHTADGVDQSPALRWSELPSTTVEVAVICDDPDASGFQPWVHWVVYGIPGSAKGLGEGIPRGKELLARPHGARQGTNDFRRIGWGGPRPPFGTHHYHFTLYALDVALELRPGASKHDLLDAMDGHVLDVGELIGTYTR